MLELFFLGSKLFMGIQIIAAVVMIILSIVSAKAVLGNQIDGKTKRKTNLIREVGLFAFIIGVLASAIDLMGAFQSIAMASYISPSLLAAGLKITLITTVYGLTIYSLSLLIWFVLNWKVSKNMS
jgi:biopolymer transport protein ExbB/TolQ